MLDTYVYSFKANLNVEMAITCNKKLYTISVKFCGLGDSIMAETKYVNILDDVETDKKESESAVESTSGILTNDTNGVCPKCKNNMGSGIIAGGEEVYYCKTCRVSSPLEMLDNQ